MYNIPKLTQSLSLIISGLCCSFLWSDGELVHPRDYVHILRDRRPGTGVPEVPLVETLPHHHPTGMTHWLALSLVYGDVGDVIFLFWQ